MLDANSLEIITRFNQAVLSKKIPVELTNIAKRNRGSKLTEESSLEGLTTKVVEYDGVNHLVLTNDNIERSNQRNKRNFYEEDDEKDENDDDEDSEDEHPFKKIKIADVLAPLNHPSELISHPAISKTYKLPIFNKLASELIELIEIEQNNLNHLNNLLQVLNGEDWYYLLEENLGLPKYDHGLNINEDENEIKINDKTDETDKDQDPFFALPQALKDYESFNNRENLEDDALDNLKEELINYLQASIQRQFEYIKNLSQLRNGIVRADRLKRDLYKWGKEMHDKKSI